MTQQPSTQTQPDQPLTQQPEHQSQSQDKPSSSYADTRRALLESLNLQDEPVKAVPEAPVEVAEEPVATKVAEPVKEAPVEPPRQPYLTLKDLQEYQALLQEKENLARKTAELEEKARIAELLRTDPLKAHELAGFSYEDITNAYVKGTKLDPKIEHHPVVQGLQQQLQQMQSLLGELQQERATISLTSHIQETADKRPYTNRLFGKNKERVLQVAHNYMRQGLDRDQALDTIEEELKELSVLYAPVDNNPAPPKAPVVTSAKKPSVPAITSEHTSTVSNVATKRETYEEMKRRLFSEG